MVGVGWAELPFAECWESVAVVVVVAIVVVVAAEWTCVPGRGYSAGSVQVEEGHRSELMLSWLYNEGFDHPTREGGCKAPQVPPSPPRPSPAGPTGSGFSYPWSHTGSWRRLVRWQGWRCRKCVGGNCPPQRTGQRASHANIHAL